MLNKCKPKILYIIRTETFGFWNKRHGQMRQQLLKTITRCDDKHVAVCTPGTQLAAGISCDRTTVRHACNIRAITTAGEYVLPYHGRPQARQCAPKIAAVCARQVYIYGIYKCRSPNVWTPRNEYTIIAAVERNPSRRSRDIARELGLYPP
jgi:hypothetical protein